MLTSADFAVDYFIRPRRQWALRPPQTQCQPMCAWDLLTDASFAMQQFPRLRRLLGLRLQQTRPD